VVGIEYIDTAIEDAKANAQLNGIKNTHFFVGDIAKVFTNDFIAANGKPDIVITDPPRAGMHANVVEQLLALQPKRIVYISCNPATQARDLTLLATHYRVVKIQPVDMFPHTHHVENVVLLELQ
jgi:23S rRNA (uracil1939-C5)-methyltransferase